MMQGHWSSPLRQAGDSLVLAQELEDGVASVKGRSFASIRPPTNSATTSLSARPALVGDWEILLLFGHAVVWEAVSCWLAGILEAEILHGCHWWTSRLSSMAARLAKIVLPNSRLHRLWVLPPRSSLQGPSVGCHQRFRDASPGEVCHVAKRDIVAKLILHTKQANQ